MNKSFKIGDIVRITSVDYYKEILNCVGIIQELDGNWAGDNPIGVRLIDINGKVRHLGFNPKQLQIREGELKWQDIEELEN